MNTTCNVSGARNPEKCNGGQLQGILSEEQRSRTEGTGALLLKAAFTPLGVAALACRGIPLGDIWTAQ